MASKRQQNHIKKSGKMWISPILALGAVILVVILSKWWQTDAQADRNDPNVVVNLTSKVGKQAPSFTLTNSEGKEYTIAPGDGRKHLLIFHMGSI